MSQQYQGAVIVAVRDTYPCPGPRYRAEGEASGEQFREEVLYPAMDRAMRAGVKMVVDLDGVPGYASGFLEEAFGGLVRHGIAPWAMWWIDIEATEAPYLIADIYKYIRDAIRVSMTEARRATVTERRTIAALEKILVEPGGVQ